MAVRHGSFENVPAQRTSEDRVPCRSFQRNQQLPSEQSNSGLRQQHVRAGDHGKRSEDHAVRVEIYFLVNTSIAGFPKREGRLFLFLPPLGNGIKIVDWTSAFFVWLTELVSFSQPGGMYGFV